MKNVKNAGIRIRRLAEGYAAEGPGFYVFDENPNRLAETVREIQNGNLRTPEAMRMLLVEDALPTIAGLSTEALDR